MMSALQAFIVLLCLSHGSAKPTKYVPPIDADISTPRVISEPRTHMHQNTPWRCQQLSSQIVRDAAPPRTITRSPTNTITHCHAIRILAQTTITSSAPVFALPFPFNFH
jgi:hypothetical protein